MSCEHIRRGSWFCWECGSVCLPRDSFENLGSWNTFLIYCTDYDFLRGYEWKIAASCAANVHEPREDTWACYSRDCEGAGTKPQPLESVQNCIGTASIASLEDLFDIRHGGVYSECLARLFQDQPAWGLLPSACFQHVSMLIRFTSCDDVARVNPHWSANMGRYH